MDERAKEIIEFIASFLVDTTGNEIFEKWKAKRKISKILKEDNKNIKRIFYAVDNSDLYNLIEEFILFTAFKEVSFYSSINLTPEQEENLWEKFSEFIKAETGNNYVNGDYKDKIIRCVNLHNKAINSIIMDNQGMLHMKMMQSQHNGINNYLNQIINTLNTETKLQDEDGELNFSVEQLEMIMKSYRYDINQFQKMQILYALVVMVIFLLMSVYITSSLQYIYNDNVVLIDILLFLLFGVELIYLVLLLFIYLSAKELEKKMNDLRDSLWEVHFQLYKNQIESKYEVKVRND